MGSYLVPTLVGEKREGEARLASSNGSPVYEETWHFEVEADYATQPRHEIILTTGLPRPGLTTSGGGYTLCNAVQATRRTERSVRWDVTASFSSEVKEGQSQSSTGGDPTTPPTAWVPVYETKFERLQEIVAEDKDGDTIANSAGQPFEVGLTISRFIPVWDFYQFESATVTDEQVIERNETTNSAVFKGRAIKSLLCVVNSSVVGFYFGQRRRLTNYSLKYNSRLWTHKRLDVGTQYKSGSTRLDYLSDDGSIMLGALDGSGAKQAVGTAPAVLEFDVYEPIAFADFLRI